MIKENFSLSSSLIGICQKPLAKSKTVKTLAFSYLSKYSSMLGSGNESLFVFWFNLE